MKIASDSSWQWSGRWQWLFVSQNLFGWVRICYMVWKILCLASSCHTLNSQDCNKRLGDCRRHSLSLLQRLRCSRYFFGKDDSLRSSQSAIF